MMSKDFFKALLIYSPTLILLPQSIIYVIISLLGIHYFISDLKSNRIYKKDVFLFCFVLLSLLVYFILDPVSDVQSRSVNDLIPYSVFLLTTIFFARHVNEKVLHYILYFVLIEILVGIGEYVIGKPYIIKPAVTGEMEFGESALLYYNRVYGLSQAVSIFGYKIFIGIILLFFLKVKKYKYLMLIWLLIGLYITFNRTAIVGSIVFLILYNLKQIKYLSIKYKFLLVLFSIGIFVLTYVNIDRVSNQFFRGKENGDLSGRDRIFPYYIDFIESNLLLGNNFHKLWGQIGGSIYHAHNSYLQSLANMGIVFFILLLVYLLSFVNKKNIVFLFPLFLYSSFQYGILWGVSFLDIIFFSLLFYHFNKKSI